MRCYGDRHDISPLVTVNIDGQLVFLLKDKVLGGTQGDVRHGERTGVVERRLPGHAAGTDGVVDMQTMFDVIRRQIDKLELIVDDSLWPLPKYRELLFIR